MYDNWRALMANFFRLLTQQGFIVFGLSFNVLLLLWIVFSSHYYLYFVLTGVLCFFVPIGILHFIVFSLGLCFVLICLEFCSHEFSCYVITLFCVVISPVVCCINTCLECILCTNEFCILFSPLFYILTVVLFSHRFIISRQVLCVLGSAALRYSHWGGVRSNWGG